MKNYDLNMDGYISLEDFEKIAANFPFSFCTHESDRYEAFYTLIDATPKNTQEVKLNTLFSSKVFFFLCFRKEYLKITTTTYI